MFTLLRFLGKPQQT